MRTYVAAKLHGLTVTEATVDYHGSVSIDVDLLDRAGIETYEQVHVVNLTTGARWVTYALPAAKGQFTLNGGGARLGVVGDRCVVMTFQTGHAFEGAAVLMLGPDNAVIDVLDYY